LKDGGLDHWTLSSV